MTSFLPALPSLPWPLKSSSTRPDPATSEPEPEPEPEQEKKSLLDSLIHYASSGVAPPSARVDPRQRVPQYTPVRFRDVWKYGLVAASKGVELTTDVLSHAIWGPRKKSWGIEMTIISSVMRGVGQHSGLIDIGTLRLLMSIGGLVPLPSDAFVTPVTFKVRKRNLRGILAEFDAAEDGTRELYGEWVVGKKTWHRLQAEWKANKAEGQGQTMTSHQRKERVVLYIHGGAYYLSSAAAQRIISIPLSKYTDTRVFAIDYRLAPETRFPGPLHDAVSGYFRLVEDLHIPAENIIIAGDSAGGGLSLALIMYLRDNNYSLPSAAILMSPWVDLTMSCDSWDSNAVYDVVPFPDPGSHMNPVALYLGEHMEKYLTHPYASPLFGDFTGLPPILIQAGDAEVLRDEITLLAHKATTAGVQVRHELYEDAIHIFQAYPFLDSANQAFMSCREFIRHALPSMQTKSPQTLGLSTEVDLEHEIDNDKARVVRGDGVEVGDTDAQATGPDEDLTGLTSEDSDDPVVQKVYPSWGRAKTFVWTSHPEDGVEDDDPSGPSSGVQTPAGIRTPEISISTLRRISSAFSIVQLSDSASRNHKRSPSYQPNGAPSPPSYRRTRPNSMRIPSFSMSPMDAPLASPSLRRSVASESHPDLTSLVNQFNKDGPAHETLLFKPHQFGT